MELIKLEDLFKTYHLGEVDVPVLKGVSLTIERGEMVGADGRLRLGQDDADEHPGLPGPPHLAANTGSTARRCRSLSPTQRAMVRNRKSASCSRASTCCRAPPPWTSVMPLAYSPTTAPTARGNARGRRAAGTRRPGRPRGPRALAAFRRPAAARGHRPLAGQPTRRCCWPTSRRAISTRAPARKSCGCSSSSTPRKGSPSSW